MTARTETIQHRTVDDNEAGGWRYNYPFNVLDRVVWFLAGLLFLLLAFRFVLALLGANPANWFAHFIYSTSYPFVAPFFGLFSYNYSYGVSHFEVYTLVAIVVYMVIAWILSSLVNLGRR